MEKPDIKTSSGAQGPHDASSHRASEVPSNSGANSGQNSAENSGPNIQREAENNKRRRERRIAIFFAFIIVCSTLIQAFLTSRRQDYGFVQSILYFGLVHLNVILIMFLVFLVSRNLVKAYLARRSGTLGASFRWRLVTSLLGFTVVPSILLFVASSYVIRQGFDRWFSGQVSTALEDAQAITKVHYDRLEEELAFYANQSVDWIKGQSSAPGKHWTQLLLGKFPVQAVEIYSDLSAPPYRSTQDQLPDWAVPRAAVESLERAFGGASFDLIRQYGDGDLVQRFLLIKVPGASPNLGGIPGAPLEKKIVLVLSQNVPLGLKTRISDLKTAFSSYQKTFNFKESLKTNYTLILLTLFVLVLFVVSWFGLYITKSITEPVSELLKATVAFREGEWNYRIPQTISIDQKNLHGLGTDLDTLKASFNLMAEEVGRRGRQLEEANGQLISLVRELEDRERYLEILLSSIRRGVLVLDPKGNIMRANAEALQFSNIDEKGENIALVIGKSWREIFSNLGSNDETKAWLEEARVARGKSIDRIFEIRIESQDQVSLKSLRCTGITLTDDHQEALGWMIILEDVSDAARLEKLAAWQEVARRVAHEIKNPLTPIQISADRLVRRMSERMESDVEDGPVFRECLGQIQKQVRVIRDLVREFSQFAKLPEPTFQNLVLTAFLQRILQDYRFTHPNVEFAYSSKISQDSDIEVRGDPEYIRRLVVNLADNALQSVEEAKVARPKFEVEVRISNENPKFVQVVFEDNGPGIPEGLREKIFDPYVTSKASGLGLGLPIVRRIAIEHQGRIRCEEAKGARFVLELPILKVKDILAKERHA